VLALMPFSRQRSATFFSPLSASCSIPTICSSVYAGSGQCDRFCSKINVFVLLP
jgi:hypothetical protein